MIEMNGWSSMIDIGVMLREGIFKTRIVYRTIAHWHWTAYIDTGSTECRIVRRAVRLGHVDDGDTLLVDGGGIVGGLARAQSQSSVKEM